MTDAATAPLRVHSVGAGYFARFQVEAWHKIAGTQLIGLSDIDTARAHTMLNEIVGADHGIAVFDNPDAMFASDHADIIDIATPPETHLDLIRAALKVRPQVIICQKPFCGTIEAAKEATRLAKDAGIPLVVHENFRFQPWYRAMKAEIDIGRLGEIFQIAMRLRPGDGQGDDAYLARQPYFREMKRFLIHETGIHYVDVFRFLLGEPTAVFADLRQVNKGIAGEDAGLVIFKFGDHCRAVFDGNRSADHAADDRRLTLGDCLVEGENGTMSLDGFGALQFRPLHEVTQTSLGKWQADGFGAGCVNALQQHIVDHIVSGEPLENLAENYLRNLEIEAAIYRSSDQGTWVEL